MSSGLPARLEVSLGLWQDRPPEEVLETAAIADALGYPAVWMGEMATYDVFALATAIGMRGPGADLVVGPLAVTVRDPAMIAMGAASVASLTGRRVGVALGTSSTVVVEQWHGRSRAQVSRALAESAGATRRLLDGDRADVDGAVVRSQGYRLRLPAPRAELIVAAAGPRAVEVAARWADRMVLNLVTPALAATMAGRLDEAARRAGRPRPRIAVWATAAVDPAPAALLQLRRGVVPYLAAPGYAEMFERAGFADLVAAARGGEHPRTLLERVPDELLGAVGVVGDLEQARARVAAFASAGVDDVVLVASATDTDPAGERTLRALAELAGLSPRTVEAAPPAGAVAGG